MTIKEQTILIRLQNQKEKIKMREEKQKLILQQKEEQQEHIKNYLFSHYEITKKFKRQNSIKSYKREN